MKEITEFCDLTHFRHKDVQLLVQHVFPLSLLSHFIVLPSFPFLDMRPFENIAVFPTVTNCEQLTERKTEHMYI